MTDGLDVIIFILMPWMMFGCLVLASLELNKVQMGWKRHLLVAFVAGGPVWGVMMGLSLFFAEVMPKIGRLLDER